MKRLFTILMITIFFSCYTTAFANEKEKSWQETFPLLPVNLVINSATPLSDGTIQELKMQVNRNFRFPNYSIRAVTLSSTPLTNVNKDYLQSLLSANKDSAVVLLDIKTLEEFTTTRPWSNELFLVVIVQMRTYMYTDSGKYAMTNTGVHQVTEYGMSNRLFDITADSINSTFSKLNITK